MIITFIYTVPNCLTPLYGKYVGYVTDDYEDGLDMEVMRLIFPILQQYYTLSKDATVTVGILSHYRKDSIDYCSENEKNAFTLLYCKWPLTMDGKSSEIFMNGKPYTV